MRIEKLLIQEAQDREPYSDLEEPVEQKWDIVG